MKIIFILILILCSIQVYPQNSLAETKELLKIVDCKKVIEKEFNEVKLKIKSKEKELFKKHGLNYEIKEDTKKFNDLLDEFISFYKEYSYEQLLHVYSWHHSKEEVNNYITLAKRTNYNGSIMEESNVKVELDSIFNRTKK